VKHALARALAAARSRRPRPTARAPAAADDAVGHSRARWLAPAALLAACAALAALAIGELSGSGGGARGVSAARTHHPARSAPPRTPAAASPARAPTVPPTPVSAALAAQLEAHGHELLEAGQAATAVPVLQRALLATGERLDGCVEPVSETCLDYAYALYDLGRALLLDHQPAAAVLILERRLRIANQQSTVQSELALARQEAGQRGALTAASG
jgi:tetratricopeptide (TPR) repeat protein